MLKSLIIIIITSSIDIRSYCSHIMPTSNVHYIGETHWQLFNDCSRGMLQSFIGFLNAKGYPDRHCLTDWNIIGKWDGTFRLQHSQSKKFICFNRRARITLRLNGKDSKCTFLEEIRENGFSRLRSAWMSELYLGFNGRGRFQNPLSYHLKPRCFDWIKLVRYVTESEKNSCETTSPPKNMHNLEHQNHLHHVARANFLKKVSAS